MREIKFRGKRIDNGEWAYGYYAVHKMMLTGEMDYFIIVNEQRPQSVDPKTVGQYTGLKDKNGKEIYEGDIIDTGGENWLVEPIGTEERDGGRFGLCASPHGNGEAYWMDKSIYGGEVIGNIYTHPELLEEAK